MKKEIKYYNEQKQKIKQIYNVDCNQFQIKNGYCLNIIGYNKNPYNQYELIPIYQDIDTKKVYNGEFQIWLDKKGYYYTQINDYKRICIDLTQMEND